MSETAATQRTEARLIPIEPETDRAHAVWKHLIDHLEKNELPREDGTTVRCVPEDFMLMGERADGSVLFKNSITRAYLNFDERGRPVVGKRAVFETHKSEKFLEMVRAQRDQLIQEARAEAVIRDETISQIKQRGANIEPITIKGQRCYAARMPTTELCPETFHSPSRAWSHLAERLAIEKPGRMVFATQDVKLGGVEVSGKHVERSQRYEIRQMEKGPTPFAVFLVEKVKFAELSRDVYQLRLHECGTLEQAARTVAEELFIVPPQREVSPSPRFVAPHQQERGGRDR